MLSTKPDLPQKFLQIKKDDKFYSKLLAKENSMDNSSSRVYNRVASVGVPFTWESQPGTPKHTFSQTSLPPLTPPPSYFFNSNKKPIKKTSKSNLFLNILPRLINPRKTHLRSSTTSSSSLSRSSSLHSSSSSTNPSNFGSSFDYMGEDEDPSLGSSPSISCFGDDGLRGRSWNSWVIMKKALLSIVGHGSGQGTTV